jgi:phosphoesterase RecJ-like protein
VRSLEGTELAAVIRDRLDGARSARKVSLRSTSGAIDVSEIARRHGGGGHARAAGFSTDLPYGELVESLRAELAARR